MDLKAIADSCSLVPGSYKKISKRKALLAMLLTLPDYEGLYFQGIAANMMSGVHATTTAVNLSRSVARASRH